MNEKNDGGGFSKSAGKLGEKWAKIPLLPPE